ncbi:hypothetical protein Trydic_g20318 [Trypoxylus dichotomus]
MYDASICQGDSFIALRRAFVKTIDAHLRILPTYTRSSRDRLAFLRDKICMHIKLRPDDAAANLNKYRDSEDEDDRRSLPVPARTLS